ncbi:MAG TPA: hypothetical protein EYN67_12395 [Flavobacteriales bacterium]|nr:hypothetical protein [Methylococcaceae bacterium]HHZ96322.1 hypothetical protein [Flavobacteriales bacterium]
MKSIKDAYEELKGDLSDTFMFDKYDKYLYYLGRSGYIAAELKTTYPDGQYICTVEEFNNYKPESSSVWLRKPEKPVYTQVMADAGELPSVGMEFIDLGCDNPEIPKVCLAVDGTVVVYKNSTFDYQCAEVTECKPLIPHIDLIDGKAYLFNLVSGTQVHVGIYSKTLMRFILEVSHYDVSKCANIQLLEVVK